MILAIGDLHFKESLGYSDLFEDKRENERQEILDFIVESVKDCDKVVFLGDQLNARNNTSEVIRAFVEFVERFDDKQVYIIAGNHEKKCNGRSAIDFLAELKKPNLHVIINEIVQIDGMVFCPYFTKAELNAKDNDEGLAKITAWIDSVRTNIINIHSPSADIFFCHFAISDTLVQSGLSTNIFDEIVLPKVELEKIFKLVVGGHIHKPKSYGRTIISGSVFNNEVGEEYKAIWKIKPEDKSYQEVPLPGRKIKKFENPSILDIGLVDVSGTIAKVIITDKSINVPLLRKAMVGYDAVVISEQYPSERTKTKNQKTLVDFSIENLLSIYAKEKKIDNKILMEGFNLIKGV